MTTSAVAQSLKIDESRLVNWERGEGSPTYTQLNKLANLYKRPTSVFYLPEPPHDFTIMRDFRSIASAEVGDFSPQLALAIRESRERVAWISEYLRSTGEPPLDFVGAVSLETSADVAGRRLRRLLQIPLQQQFATRSPSEAFGLWKRKCEAIGVCVFAVSRVETEEMRGFAIVDKFAPAVAINSRDSYSAKVFTLLHELAHILIAQEGISGAESAGPLGARGQKIERFCNSVAAEAAVPKRHLMRVFPKLKDRGLDGIARLAAHYRVSRLVIAKRLLDVGAIEDDLYRQVWAATQSQTEREKSPGPIPQHVQARSRVGSRFATTAINAFRDGEIGGADLSCMLKMRLSHLDQLEEMISKYDVTEEAAP